MRLRSILIVLVVAIAAGAGGWAVGSGTVAVDINFDGEPTDSELEDSVLAEINQYRSQQGLANLSNNDRVAAAAREHSDLMQQLDFYDHTTPSGEDVRDRYQMCERTGEVINAVPEYDRRDDLVEHIVDQWEDSPDHNKIITGDWSSAGVGINTSGSELLVTTGVCD